MSILGCWIRAIEREWQPLALSRSGIESIFIWKIGKEKRVHSSHCAVLRVWGLDKYNTQRTATKVISRRLRRWGSGQSICSSGRKEKHNRPTNSIKSKEVKNSSSITQIQIPWVSEWSSSSGRSSVCHLLETRRRWTPHSRHPGKTARLQIMRPPRSNHHQQRLRKPHCYPRTLKWNDSSIAYRDETEK